jgi:putative SOS response-associated peptidase YedK
VRALVSAALVSNPIGMCGRYGLSRAPWDFARRLGARVASEDEFTPRFNIAPSTPVYAIANTPQPELTQMRWGLVPAWAADPASLRLSTFNARIETIATARSYAVPTRRRRCVLPATGFYEWTPRGDVKQPYWIHPRSDEVFGFAGLWDEWRPRDGGTPHWSCTIVTAPANDFMAPVHSRMPVVLRDDAARAWLAPSELSPADALAILEPAEDASTWVMDAVSRRVGNVRNDDAGLLEPIAV